MHTFLSEKIKWYEEHVNEYFLDTIYNTDKLMVEVPEDKWFEINPTRGMREGICSYELIGSGTEIADFLICSYGETEYDRMIIDKRCWFTYNFSILICQTKFFCYLLIYRNLFIMINQQITF